jgi:hypothetical protein
MLRAGGLGGRPGLTGAVAPRQHAGPAQRLTAGGACALPPRRHAGPAWRLTGRWTTRGHASPARRVGSAANDRWAGDRGQGTESPWPGRPHPGSDWKLWDTPRGPTKPVTWAVPSPACPKTSNRIPGRLQTSSRVPGRLRPTGRPPLSRPGVQARRARAPATDHSPSTAEPARRAGEARPRTRNRPLPVDR